MEEDNKSLTANQEAIGTAMAAAVGLVVGGPAGAVIGAAAAPHLSELVHRVWGEVIALRETQLESVVDESAALAGVTPDELVETMQRDLDQRRLLYDSLIAAASSRDLDKIHGLARCLANGFEDATRVDEEALIVRALVDLDPVHIQVLKKIEEHAQSQDSVRHFLSGDLDPMEYLSSTDITGPILTVLERNALVTSETRELPVGQRGTAEKMLNKPQFSCTDFGRECLSRLGNNNRHQTARDLFR